MNKKILIISLVLLAAVVIIFGGAFLLKTPTNTGAPENTSNNALNNNNQQEAIKQNVTGEQNSEITLLNLEEIAKHNLKNDCWVIVENKVYNVSDFIDLHPAGPDKIIPFCGKDATTAFETRGGKGPHPEKANKTLNNYYLGDFKN
jgi:cytochrome b involved in lipid metabolism